MKQAEAMQLVKALRSGRYKQAMGSLKTAPGYYCCLGVACQISKLGKFAKGGTSLHSTADFEYRVGKDPDQWNGGVLPRAVQRYFGFKSNKGCLRSVNG